METIKNEILYMKYNGHIAPVHIIPKIIKKTLTRANEDTYNMYVCCSETLQLYSNVTNMLQKLDLINNKSKAFTEISFCSSDF